MAHRLRHEVIDTDVDTLPMRRFARAARPRVSGTLVFACGAGDTTHLRAVGAQESIIAVLQRQGFDTTALRMGIADASPAVQPAPEPAA